MFLLIEYLAISALGLNLFVSTFTENSIKYKSIIRQQSNLFTFTLTSSYGNSEILTDKLVVSTPIYNYKVIDINQDGVQDFCIGMIKTTRWNSIPQPKIHIYSHKNGKIYPIWRSSKIGKNLVDFDIDTSFGEKPGIKILENPRGKIYNIALYHWKSFGLKFTKYLYTNLDSATSINFLRSKK
jgi:hypothetical protein